MELPEADQVISSGFGGVIPVLSYYDVMNERRGSIDNIVRPAIIPAVNQSRFVPENPIKKEESYKSKLQTLAQKHSIFGSIKYHHRITNDFKYNCQCMVGASGYKFLGGNSEEEAFEQVSKIAFEACLESVGGIDDVEKRASMESPEKKARYL